MGQDIRSGVIREGERDVVECDGALDSLLLWGSRYRNPRLCIQHVANFDAGGGEALDIVDEPAAHPHRHIQHPEEPIEGDQIPHRHFPADDVQAAEHQGDCIQCSGETVEPREIGTGYSCGIQIAALKVFVVLREFFDFMVFPRERFDDAVAADVFFHHRIQPGETFPDLEK